MNCSRLFLRLALIFTMLLPAMAAADTSTQTTQKVVPKSRLDIQLSFAPLVKNAAPAVVNIYTRKRMRHQQRSRLFADPFFRKFFGEEPRTRSNKKRRRSGNSLGSGVI